MLKEEFLKKVMEYSVSDVNGPATQYESGFTWTIPPLNGAWEEGSYEYFCKEFLSGFWLMQELRPKGGKGSICFPRFMGNIPEGLFRIDYNKTGGMAIAQYVNTNNAVKCVYYKYSSAGGWSSSISASTSFSKLWDSIPHLEPKGIDFLIHTEDTFASDIMVINNNEVFTPKEGFHANIGNLVEFTLIEASNSVVRAHIKRVINGGSKFNQLVEVTVKDGCINMTRTDVEEDWWGLQLPDFKTPYFNCATPYNKSIHKHLPPPVYAGENLWITGFNLREYPFVKMQGNWLPMADLNHWDMTPFVSEEVLAEYQMYLSLK